MRYIRATEPVLEDPLYADYIERLGGELSSNSDWFGSPFTFFLIDRPEVNAFAGPGGYIGVYSGLVLTSETESELAAVLAHEIAHVTQRHLLRAWDSTSNMSMISAASLIGAILLGLAGGGDAAIAAAAGAQAALVQQQINFTRANEKEADRIGIGILAQTGYDPRSMPSFFERMARAHQSYSTEIPEFLRTHPVTKNRIADSMGRAEQHPYRQRPDSLQYHLIKASLRERSFIDPRDSLDFFTLALEQGRYSNRIATLYGLALAQLRGDQPEAAAETLAQGLQDHPHEPAFILAKAQSLEALERSQDAIALLRNELQSAPRSYPLQMALAELLVERKQAQAAYDLLSSARQQRPENIQILALLSRATAQLGRMAESHEHLGEYHYQRGNLEAALMQFEIALRQPRTDFYQTARIESRLARVRAEKEQLEAEQGGKP
jgi:predicted Zn-dependent protease